MKRVFPVLALLAAVLAGYLLLEGGDPDTNRTLPGTEETAAKEPASRASRPYRASPASTTRTGTSVSS